MTVLKTVIESLIDDMESNRERRGFKGKLAMSFYRAPKPSSVQFSSKVKPAPSPSTASLAFIAGDELVVPAVPAPKKNTSFVKKDGGGDRNCGDSFSEESVDRRAATYISCVQERFKLESLSGGKKEVLLGFGGRSP